MHHAHELNGPLCLRHPHFNVCRHAHLSCSREQLQYLLSHSWSPLFLSFLQRRVRRIGWERTAACVEPWSLDTGVDTWPAVIPTTPAIYLGYPVHFMSNMIICFDGKKKDFIVWCLNMSITQSIINFEASNVYSNRLFDCAQKLVSFFFHFTVLSDFKTVNSNHSLDHVQKTKIKPIIICKRKSK